MLSPLAMRLVAGVLVLSALVASSATRASARHPLDIRLNEIQVLGSHNSYHIQPDPVLIDLYLLFDPRAYAWEYSHPPLTEQLERLGIRQIELDVYADPDGGLFAEPLGLEVLAGTPVHLAALDPPGLKVLHVADLDVETTCATLVECLGAVRSWSDSHPEHLPIMILIEVKDDPPPDLSLPFVTPIPFGTVELDALDAEIRTVFPAERLLTPDDVRGSRSSLERAILTDGWPLLRSVRGRVLFALDNGGRVRDDYVAGHPSLAGRVLFVDAPPGTPEAGFVKLNDSIGDGARITELVRAGYLIRTRADADTEEARTGDVTRRDAALASGAQFVSTDYADPSPFGTGYVVAIPGGSPARCNPVRAPQSCLAAALENLSGRRPVRGKRLLVRDGRPDERRRLRVVATDPLFDTPLPGTASDPSIAGATLDLDNPVTGEAARIHLPSGDGWRRRGTSGWTYRDPRGAAGPCRRVVMRRGRGFRAACSGSAIPFTLDEASQGALVVSLRLGAGPVHCAVFGGTILADAAVAKRRGGRFKAKNAAAPPACP